MMNRPDAAPRKLTALESICRRAGLPLTVQRRVVLEALARRMDHPTADEVLEEVRRRLPEISRTTVYRVLDTLVRLGLAVKICSPGAAVRFDAKTERHHHLVCVQCEKVLDLEAPKLNRITLPESAASAFDIHDYSIHFRGVCADCRAARPAGAKHEADTARGRRRKSRNQEERR